MTSAQAVLRLDLCCVPALLVHWQTCLQTRLTVNIAHLSYTDTLLLVNYFLCNMTKHMCTGELSLVNTMQGFYDTLAMILITTVDDIKVCIAYFHAAGDR